MGWGGSWKVGRKRERLEKKMQDTHWSHQRNDRKQLVDEDMQKIE